MESLKELKKKRDDIIEACKADATATQREIDEARQSFNNIVKKRKQEMVDLVQVTLSPLVNLDIIVDEKFFIVRFENKILLLWDKNDLKVHNLENEKAFEILNKYDDLFGKPTGRYSEPCGCLTTTDSPYITWNTATATATGSAYTTDGAVAYLSATQCNNDYR